MVGRDNGSVGVAIVKSEIAFNKVQLLPLSLASSSSSSSSSTSFASFLNEKRKQGGKFSLWSSFEERLVRGGNRSLNRSAKRRAEKNLIIWEKLGEFVLGVFLVTCHGRREQSLSWRPFNATKGRGTRKKKVGRPAKNSKRGRIFPGNKFPSFLRREQPSKYGIASLSSTWKKLESLTHCR